jgi:hypothetical protein
MNAVETLSQHLVPAAMVVARVAGRGNDESISVCVFL